MADYKEIRKTLHEHPQTAGCEEYAHDMIVRHLQGLHPDKVYTHVGGYGVIAVWGKDPAAPTVAFRADTDALPIGHRCGHDGHTTILLRLAELIDANVSTYQRINILLLWQPAEETGTGSRAVIESGILQQYNITAFYALHNLPGYPLGTVVLCPHTFAAASTGVVYRLDGRETHASTPELGVNPGLAVAEIINRFSGFNEHSLNQSSIQTFKQSTLICVRLGQPAFGTSAGHGEVMFTLRAFTNSAMERLLADANRTVDEVAERYGLTVSRSLVEPFRATENHPECVNVLMRECVSADATNTNAITQSHVNAIIKDEPFRWSEDFAEYLLLWPGAMFGIGSGEQQPELHHPDYDFPDALVEPAAQLFFRLTTEC
ncbi:MAG: amidohydrolase [Bacteroidales bacterium]|nr:amidohydrolase [Bacteroidales bacterium]